MIYDIFLPFLIIFSIFVIIIILARKMPEIFLANEGGEKQAKEDGKKHSAPTSLFCFILSAFEKILRQIRIHILKLDAKIFSCIEYLRRESAKKIKEVNKFSYKNITRSAIENKAGGISLKFQFKTEETKLLHTIAESPKNAANYKKLGDLYLKNNNFKDAEASFGEYLKLNPEDKEAEKVLGEIKEKNGKMPS